MAKSTATVATVAPLNFAALESAGHSAGLAGGKQAAFLEAGKLEFIKLVAEQGACPDQCSDKLRASFVKGYREGISNARYTLTDKELGNIKTAIWQARKLATTGWTKLSKAQQSAVTGGKMKVSGALSKAFPPAVPAPMVHSVNPAPADSAPADSSQGAPSADIVSGPAKGNDGQVRKARKGETANTVAMGEVLAWLATAPAMTKLEIATYAKLVSAIAASNAVTVPARKVA